MGTGTRHTMALMLCTEKVTQCKPGNHLKWYVNQLKEEEEEEEEKKRKKCLALEPKFQVCKRFVI